MRSWSTVSPGGLRSFAGGGLPASADCQPPLPRRAGPMLGRSAAALRQHRQDLSQYRDLDIVCGVPNRRHWLRIAHLDHKHARSLPDHVRLVGARTHPDLAAIRSHRADSKSGWVGSRSSRFEGVRSATPMWSIASEKLRNRAARSHRSAKMSVSWAGAMRARQASASSAVMIWSRVRVGTMCS